jgi:hypothetical protein
MLPFASVDLTGRFEPAGGGPPLSAIGVRTVQLTSTK